MSGKIILITGAAGGIGAALARQLAARGDSLALADLDHACVTRLATELGPKTLPIALDVRSPEQWQQALDLAWQHFGHVDVLVNNAGFLSTGYARNVTLDQHRLQLEVNVMGPITGMLAALPRFRQQGHGHLVTTGSMSSFVPHPGLASYAASKHALRAFHHSLALEERDGPVRFTIVHPAAIETPMLKRVAQMTDDSAAVSFAERTYSADQVARLFVRAIDTQPLEVVMPAGFGHFMRLGAAMPGLVRRLIIQAEKKGSKILAQRRR